MISLLSFFRIVSLIIPLALFSIPLSLSAKDFGTMGHTFEIEEQDIIEFIQEKLDSMSEDELVHIQEKITEKHVETFKSPAPVKGLKKASRYRMTHFDPICTAKSEIKDNEGITIVKRGQTYNPLEHVSLGDNLLFLDGTDEKQIQWALEQENSNKWILVNGRPMDLEEKLNLPVYFDQRGVLVKKFGIKATPAKISQDGKKLKIEELPL